MAHKKSMSRTRIKKLMAKLEDRPELFEQFERILELSDPKEGGKGLDINRLEGFLIPEIRATGKAAISEFGRLVEEEEAKQVKADEPEATMREKKR